MRASEQLLRSSVRGIAAVMALLLVSNASWSVPPSHRPPAFSADQVLVAFRPGTPAAGVSAAHSQAGGQPQRTIPAIGVHVVKVPAGTALESVQRYRRNPNILYAEPNYLRPLILPTEGTFGGGVDVFDEQWNLHNQGTALQTYTDPNTGAPVWQHTRADADIDAPEAWDIDQGDPNVWVAVADSGVDCNHGDLLGKCVHNQDYVTPTVDSFGTPIPELIDRLGHGTHVAGTIAMETNNGNGGAGVGWNTSIGSFKVCYAEVIAGFVVGSSCQDADIATAIIAAADMGFRVINMSFGQAAPSQVVENALNYAAQQGVVLVAAAGNNGDWERFHPAAYSNVMSVGATNPYDDRAPFSTFSVPEDPWVDVLAPGDPVLSTVPGDFCGGNPQCFQWLQGTSMAAPHVSGVAALLWSYLLANEPVNATRSEVRRRIQDCADQTGAMGQNMLAWSAYGRLNAHGALTCGGGAVSSPQITSPVPGSTLSDTTQEFTWTANSTSVSAWWLWVGTTVGGRQILNSGNLGGNISHTVSGLPCDGSTIYVRLWHNTAGSWVPEDFEYTAASDCAAAGTPEMTSPPPGSTLGDSTETFSWAANSTPVVGWWLWVGITPGGQEVLNSGYLGTSTSHTVNGLPCDGSTVYVRLFHYTDSRWLPVDFQYTAASACGG